MAFFCSITVPHHYKIPYYISTCFASTLVVLPNLIIRRTATFLGTGDGPHGAANLGNSLGERLTPHHLFVFFLLQLVLLRILVTLAGLLADPALCEAEMMMACMELATLAMAWVSASPFTLWFHPLLPLLLELSSLRMLVTLAGLLADPFKLLADPFKLEQREAPGHCIWGLQLKLWYL